MSFICNRVLLHCGIDTFISIKVDVVIRHSTILYNISALSAFSVSADAIGGNMMLEAKAAYKT